jgi:KilA-N domain/Protein of unknown function (DUF3627)
MPAITFQSVDNEYEWGTYFDLEVLIMTRNSYFNATKLCKDNGKRFNNWLRNQGSDELIRSTHFRDQPIITISTGLNDYRGTYVPRKLITHIASWISTDIACKVHDIVEEYLLKEEKIKHSLVTKGKDDRIDELLKICKLNDKKLDNMSLEMSKLSLENKITHEKLDIAQDTLDIVVEDRVIKPEDKGMTNTVIIYEYDLNKFRIFRVQKRSANRYIKRYLSTNPNAVKFAEIDYNPNSVNYFIRFKEQLKGDIKWYYNKFELLNITKDQLKEFIMKINEEKYKLEETF